MARTVNSALTSRLRLRRTQTRALGNRRGQTSLEYLLLMAMCFITAYLTVTGPLGDMATYIVDDLRSGIRNMIRNGEWKYGTVVNTGEPGHPLDGKRLRPLHL